MKQISKRNSRIRLAATLLSTFLPGCGMEHEMPGKPSSQPIPAVHSGALYVVNGGSNSLTVIHAGTDDIAGTITLKNASYPHHASLSPDRSLLALAIPGMDLSGGHAGGHAMKGALLLMEASTGKSLASRTFEFPNQNASFSPDGKEIWTSQMAMPGKVLVLDAGTLETRKTIGVGDSPAEVTFSQDGKHAFVANGMSNSVTVIDASSKAVVKTIPVGVNPVGAWPGNDTIMYVDNETDRTLTAIHATTLEVVRTYALGFTPGMAATDSRKDLWVTDSDNGKVVFFSSGSAVKSGDLATGAGAHGIAFSLDGGTAYVSNQAAGTVSVIDAGKRTIRNTVTVGKHPNGMAFR